MSDYGYVVDRAKKAFDAVAKLEAELQRQPDNRALQVNLVSQRRLAERAKEELDHLAALNVIEVCEYRLVPEEGGGYSLGHVAESLLKYQLLFSQIYDSVKSGPKKRAVFGREAEKESALEFGYTFSGSLGVVLLAKSDRDFFSGSLDKPIEALYQILDINNKDDVRDIANHLGRAVVTRVHGWSVANIQGGFSTDVYWKRSDGRQLSQFVDRRRMELIVGFIEAASDTVTTPIEVTGMLVGANIVSRTFHLVVPSGDAYMGRISDEIDLDEGPTLGKLYNAKIDISETFYYATERTDRINNLVDLVLV